MPPSLPSSPVPTAWSSNTRLRADPALQRAFGCTGCPEQSVVQDTLDACDATSVTQLAQALTTIFRQHAQAYRHPYATQLQLLDLDLTGLPSGPTAALAARGYFAHHRARQGRQLGRVLATRYQELVVERLAPGNTPLTTLLQPLMEAAEATLELDAAKRARTVVRIDSGGGSLADVNWLLARGYQVHTKDFSTTRATKLAARVRHWVADPAHPGRELGWVPGPAPDYVRPVRRLACRVRRRDGRWAIAVLISNVDQRALLQELGLTGMARQTRTALRLADAWFYDQRGGGVETATKEDKHGLGLTRRSKQWVAAQQMVVGLGTLVHNVLVWARRWLAAVAAPLGELGLQRLVRDALTVLGWVAWDRAGQVRAVGLMAAHPLARHLLLALQALLAPAQILVYSGETWVATLLHFYASRFECSHGAK